MANITDHQVELTPLEALELGEKLIASARNVLAQDKRREERGEFGLSAYDYQTLVGEENRAIRTLRIRISET